MIKRPGVYLLTEFFDPALKRGRHLMFMFFARAKPQLVLVDEINSRMASQGSVSEDRHEEASVIRGHHVYKSVWTHEGGEELSLVTEDGNEHDKYAVAVIKDGYVVGHMPRARAIVHVARYRD